MQFMSSRKQMLVPLPNPALGTTGRELVNNNPHWYAGVAMIAMRTIGESATAAKTNLHQVTIDSRINQMTGCRYLGACQSIRQIAARIRCGGVELQRRCRKIIQLTHDKNTISRFVQGSLPILLVFD